MRSDGAPAMRLGGAVRPAAEDSQRRFAGILQRTFVRVPPAYD